MDFRTQVGDQIGRIVSSDLLSRSPSLCRFLRFVVDETVDGRGESLKEYIIGLQVFDRDSSYDPRIDPIVRVQARKLRSRLDEYYQGPGAADPLIIELPKGRYVPSFSTKPTPTSERRISGKLVATTAAGLLGIVLVVAARWAAFQHSSTPIVVKQLTFGAGAAHDPVISHDGQLLAYSADRNGEGSRQIWIASLRSGDAAPITCRNANHVAPDFSPDGKHVAFRSFENGGGIYISPVSGGEEKRIVDSGFRPRFSPDGAWLAYLAIEESGNASVYVVATPGGKPLRVSEGMTNAACPVWHSENSEIAFIGTDSPGGAYDLWVTKFPGGKPLRTGASEELRRIKGTGLTERSCVGDWIGDRITVATEDQVWQFPFSTRKGKLTRSPLQLLPGPVLLPRIGRTMAGERVLVYTQGLNIANIWTIPVDANVGIVRGPIEQVTRDGSVRGGISGTRASLSLDGMKLAYDSLRSGSPQAWLRDIGGRESKITTEPMQVHRALQSQNGAVVAIDAEVKHQRRLYLYDVSEKRTRELCQTCGQLGDISSDGRQILVIEPHVLKLVDSHGSARTLFHDPLFDPQEVSLSPDQNWIALVTGEKGKKKLSSYVIRLGGGLATRQEWIPITEEQYEFSLHWSPDGNLLYFLHQRDGFRCLWAQPLHPATKELVQPAFVVQHFHSSQHYPFSGSWMAVADNRIALTLSESRSNIWMARFRSARLP
jgi:eukaryotic-like serine/threonine-protein kinase